LNDDPIVCLKIALLETKVKEQTQTIWCAAGKAGSSASRSLERSCLIKPDGHFSFAPIAPKVIRDEDDIAPLTPRLCGAELFLRRLSVNPPGRGPKAYMPRQFLVANLDLRS